MIGKNTLIQIILTGLGGLISFFILSFSARIFGPVVLGNLAYLFSLTGLIFAFSDLGFSKSHGFYTSSSQEPGKNLFTFLSIKSILLLTSTIIAFIYAYFFHPSTSWQLLTLVILIQVLTRFSDSILITFEAKQQSLPQNLVKILAKLLRLISIFIFARVLTNELGFSLTYLIEAGFLLFLSLILITRFKPLSFSKKLFNKYLIYALPFFAIVPLSYIQDNSLVVILKKFASADQVGFYSASANLSGSIKTLYATAMLYFFPKISKLFSENNHQQIKEYLNMASKYLLVIFTPVFMLTFLFRLELIQLVLGSKFLPAIPVFSILLLGTYILMILAPYDQALYATKNHRPLILVNIVGLLLAIALSFWLAPIYGAIGTVTASISAWILSGFWHLYLVKKRLSISLLPQLPIILLPAIGLLILLQIPQSFVIKLILSPLAVLIYYFILWQLKVVNKLDYKYLKSIIKPK
ncbi:MAG: oligosaccharide flippase family protein [Candidatus Beckwithbacteria bacterium]